MEWGPGGGWKDADTGAKLPQDWHIGHLGQGDTYDRGDGVVWTVKEVNIDPRSGGIVVVAHGTPPPPQAAPQKGAPTRAGGAV